MYFECSLPDKAPSYIASHRRKEMEEVFAKVKARHQKLEDALTMSGMDGATFSECIRDLFVRDVERFDALEARELAAYAQIGRKPGYTAEPRMEWPNAEVVADCNFLTEHEWVTIRHLGIGGSDASICYGSSAYNTPYSLYHDKCWNAKAKEADEPQTAEERNSQVFFDRGHAMEGKVVEQFGKLFNAKRIPESRMFRSKKYPCCMADIDALFLMPDGSVMVFEAKTAVSEKFDEWTGGKIPATYLPQTRHYPAVLDDERVHGTHIGCLFTYDYKLGGIYVGSDSDVGRFQSSFVPRDTAMENDLLAIEARFWEEHILAGVEPPFGNSARAVAKDKTTFAATHPTPDATAPVITLEDEAADAAEQYFKLLLAKKKRETEIEALEGSMAALATTIRERMGNSAKGMIPAEDRGEDTDLWFSVSHRRGRSKLDRDLAAVRYPQLLEQIEECSTRGDDYDVITCVEKAPKPEQKA